MEVTDLQQLTKQKASRPGKEFGPRIRRIAGSVASSDGAGKKKKSGRYATAQDAEKRGGR